MSIRMASALGAAVIAASLLAAPPAQARTLSEDCRISSYQPTTDGVNVYGVAGVGCKGAFAARVGAQIEQQQTIGWSGGMWARSSTYDAGMKYLESPKATFHCDGDGTRTYHIRGWARDIWEGTAYFSPNPGTKLVC